MFFANTHFHVRAGCRGFVMSNISFIIHQISLAETQQRYGVGQPTTIQTKALGPRGRATLEN